MQILNYKYVKKKILWPQLRQMSPDHDIKSIFHEMTQKNHTSQTTKISQKTLIRECKDKFHPGRKYVQIIFLINALYLEYIIFKTH